MNNGNGKQIGGPGNSSNPRPGQSPFPNTNALVRQTPTNAPSSQPYTSSYSNNFDRTNARYSTGRTDESRYSQENNDYTIPPRSPPRRQPRQEQAGRAWEDSIYGMYGDVKTPRDIPPPPRPNQQQRRQYQQEQQEDEDSYDEEVPRRPEPEPQSPRYSRSRTSPGPGPEPQRRNTTRQQSDRQGRQDRRDRRDQQDGRERRDQQNGDGNTRRVHINIDTGGDGSRSWTWSTDETGRTNVNLGTPFGGSGPSLVNFGTPFGDSGFPFGGRNNNGGRLPVNIPFGGGINLPFGL